MLSIFSFFLFVSVVTASRAYNIDLIDLPANPVISSIDGNSLFAQSFNPTWVASKTRRGLLVRAQNCSEETPGGRCVHCSGEGERASSLVFASLQGDDGATVPFPRFSRIDFRDTVLSYDGDIREIFGTEDPRAFYDSASMQWFVFYTCYGRKPSGDENSVLLCLATTKDPTVSGGWKKHGPVFPTVQDSKSAALVAPASPGQPYTLIFGAGKINVCKSMDPTKWKIGDCSPFLAPRPESWWDNTGVESGPPPMRLSTGDLLFIVNAWDKDEVYRPGFVILDGQDASRIIQRSDLPFIEDPIHPWDRGTFPYTCNVRDVVFVEAAHETEQPDVFRLYFGGADAVIGTAVIRVTVEDAQA